MNAGQQGRSSGPGEPSRPYPPEWPWPWPASTARGPRATRVPRRPGRSHRKRREAGWRRPGLLLSATAVVAGCGGFAAVVAVGASESPRTGAVVTIPAHLAVPAPAATPSAPGGMRSITVPGSVDGYRRRTGRVADRMAENLRKAMEAAQSQYGTAYGKAKIAIYEPAGASGRPLVFVGLPGKDIPQLAAELRSRPSSAEVDSVFMGMGIMDAKDYPAGPLGGVLRCGKGNAGGTATAAACVWADGSVVGLAMTPLNADVPGLARLTLALRNAAER